MPQVINGEISLCCFEEATVGTNNSMKRGRQSRRGRWRCIQRVRKFSNKFRATVIDQVINQGFTVRVAEERVHSNVSKSTSCFHYSYIQYRYCVGSTFCRVHLTIKLVCYI